MTIRQWVFRPSLARRLVLSLIVAFLLVGVVLVLRDYIRTQHELAGKDGIQGFGRILAAQLERIDDPAQAGFLAERLLEIANRLRAEGGHSLAPLKIQLFRREGGAIFISEGFPGQLIASPQGQSVKTYVAGGRYWLCALDSSHWSLRVAEPVIDESTQIRWLMLGMLPYMLLAFPFVLLPVWIGVRQGIKPLRTLAGYMAGRDPDDLAPVRVDLKYAELRVVIEAFDALLTKLRAKVKRERAFVEDAAHELRTPMAVIATQAHALARATTWSEREVARQALEDGIARASHLTQQLLALARLDQADATHRIEVDMTEILQRMLARLAQTAHERGIEIGLEAPDSYRAVLDPAAFHSVVENLLDNALKYVPAGGRVEIGLSVIDDGVCLRVADNGPGIAPADRFYVFERFYRGSGHDAPGTGLGLAIVRKAVGAMGAGITLDDGIDGCGVAFVITWPARMLGPDRGSLPVSRSGVRKPGAGPTVR